MLVFLSAVFWKLDGRNRELIEIGENALKTIEERTEPDDVRGVPHELHLFRHEDYTTKLRKRHIGYNRCLNGVFFVFAVVGLTIAITLGDWWWWGWFGR